MIMKHCQDKLLVKRSHFNWHHIKLSLIFQTAMNISYFHHMLTGVMETFMMIGHTVMKHMKNSVK